MNVAALVTEILINVLQLPEDTQFSSDSALLGAIPEFDSMAVVSVLTALEENLGCAVDDDEISAETFETFGSLCAFVESKI
ncbi:phosphopantetheine-binding protein [Aliiglaciecola sp. CAU 1673]|uniref:acyl carrier protein n=1 Tax=Aliiglaciecola sp. CAU 1673 TaxID=3032595 RepID=UPI0023DBDA7C|nr:phosphopantetheine-binding protein [Aliiglaciecola sp. CAU 1673]MDF2177316.1 phosphopantetheine-binding protein [Aliiglaciecola sp. CAU 1673]